MGQRNSFSITEWPSDVLDFRNFSLKVLLPAAAATVAPEQAIGPGLADNYTDSPHSVGRGRRAFVATLAPEHHPLPPATYRQTKDFR